MFGTKERVRRREICWKTGLARLEPIQLQIPTLGFNAERQSRVLATNTENLIILLFNILRRVRVNPNSYQNTEKQEIDGDIYYSCSINKYQNNIVQNIKWPK